MIDNNWEIKTGIFAFTNKRVVSIILVVILEK